MPGNSHLGLASLPDFEEWVGSMARSKSDQRTDPKGLADHRFHVGLTVERGPGRCDGDRRLECTDGTVDLALGSPAPDARWVDDAGRFQRPGARHPLGGRRGSLPPAWRSRTQGWS